MIQDMCCRETWVGGGGGVGMHCTTRATPILPDKSIISLQSGCFYKVESGLKSNGVRASWFMVAEDCGTCWTNTVAEGTDWWSFRKQTNMRDWEKKIADQRARREEPLLPSCGHLNTVQLLHLPARATAQTRLYYPSRGNWNFTGILIKLILNWNGSHYSPPSSKI